MAAVMPPPFPIELQQPYRPSIRRRTPPSPMPQQGLVLARSKGPGDFTRADSVETQRSDRSRKRQSQKAGKRPATLTESPDAEDTASPSSTLSSIRVPAQVPNSTLLEHIATSRFFHHYVSQNRTFCRLDLDFTSFVIDNATMRTSLAEAVIALGILTLPRKSAASTNAARLRYSRALRLTNKALQVNKEATSDEVLMAVILLSFFETTPNDEHSMASWTAHLDGARMLLHMRGVELLKHGPSYRMFSMLRMQILTNCLMTMQPVPQDLVDLTIQLCETQEEDDEKAGSQCVLLFGRLCNLVAASRNISYLERADILAQARQLDDDLVSWSMSLPASYEYYSEPEENNTYSGYCEVYTSLFTAEVWNIYRSARMGTNGIILEQQGLLDMEHHQLFELQGNTAPPDASPIPHSPEIDVRLAVLESLHNDVCATTPFMLGRYGPSSGQPAADIPLCRRTPAMHFLMFMLKTAGVSQGISEWAMGQVAELQGADVEVDDGAVWNSRHMSVSR